MHKLYQKIEKYMNIYFDEKKREEILQRYKYFLKASNFCDIERDLNFYYHYRNRKCITRTALRLMRKLEKKKHENLPCYIQMLYKFSCVSGSTQVLCI